MLGNIRRPLNVEVRRNLLIYMIVGDGFHKNEMLLVLKIMRHDVESILPFHDPSGIRNGPLRTRSLESVELLPLKN